MAASEPTSRLSVTRSTFKTLNWDLGTLTLVTIFAVSRGWLTQPRRLLGSTQHMHSEFDRLGGPLDPVPINRSLYLMCKLAQSYPKDTSEGTRYCRVRVVYRRYPKLTQQDMP